MISKGLAPAPNLVWMDVQGAELVALQGFGDSLTEISLIYVELSLKPLYSGQALAKEVIDFLKPHFYWHSVMNTGRWQFDAVFISKLLPANALLRGRDAALRAALQMPMKPGIARSIKPDDIARRAKCEINATRRRLLSNGGIAFTRK